MLTRPHLSYHSARSILCMKQYRIGRVHEPWSNLSPPIRSPDFYEKLAQRKADRATSAGEKRARSRASVDLSSVRLHIMPANGHVLPRRHLLTF